MANTLLTSNVILRESLARLENKLSFTRTSVNRQYKNEFAKSGAKIGATVNIRVPVKFQVNDGPSMVLQDVTEKSVPLTINQQKHVAFQFSSADLTLTVDDFVDRYVDSAITSLANAVDQYNLSLVKTGAYNYVSGSPTDKQTWLNAGAILDVNDAPRGSSNNPDRAATLNPFSQAGLVGGLAGLFNNQQKIGQQYTDGEMSDVALGFRWGMDQNATNFLSSPLGGTPIVAGAGQTGSNLTVSGFTAAAALRVRKGDHFTMGVTMVNPIDQTVTNVPQWFVATADVSSAADGTATIPIAPPITVTGPYQTVSGSPANGAALTFAAAANTSLPMNYAVAKNALTMASVDLEMPDGVDWKARMKDDQLGISMRMVRQYSIATDQFPCRIDILFGAALLRPEWTAILAG